MAIKKVISIEAPAKQAIARLILGAIAVITLVPATWQTAEVVSEGIKASALNEKAEETYERPSWSKGLSTARSSGANQTKISLVAAATCRLKMVVLDTYGL